MKMEKNIKTFHITEDGTYNYEYFENGIYNINLVPNIKVTINNQFKIEDNVEINILINKNSEVNFYSYNNLSINGIVNFNLEEFSKLNYYNLIIGDDSDFEYNINLNGEYSEVEFTNALYIDRNLKHNHKIMINHLNKHTKSNVLNYGVTNETSMCEIDIKSFIKKGCSKSSAYQKSSILSLSDNTKANISPILLIDEFDVSGGHAATVSKINKNDIYYFESRGIKEEVAKKIITIGHLQSNTPEEIYENINEILERRITNG